MWKVNVFILIFSKMLFLNCPWPWVPVPAPGVTGSLPWFLSVTSMCAQQLRGVLSGNGLDPVYLGVWLSRERRSWDRVLRWPRSADCRHQGFDWWHLKNEGEGTWTSGKGHEGSSPRLSLRLGPDRPSFPGRASPCVASFALGVALMNRGEFSCGQCFGSILRRLPNTDKNPFLLPGLACHVPTSPAGRV